jgi:hypothetical protein
MNVGDTINHGLFRFLFLYRFSHEIFLPRKFTAAQPDGLRTESMSALDRAARPFTRPGVGLGLLPADRQATTMTQAAVTSQVHQALDVHCHFTA